MCWASFHLLRFNLFRTGGCRDEQMPELSIEAVENPLFPVRFCSRMFEK
jgi:hypothetical protein